MKPSGAKAMVIGAVALTLNQMSFIEAMVSFGFRLCVHATMKVSQSPPHSVGLVTYFMSYLLLCAGGHPAARYPHHCGQGQGG